MTNQEQSKSILDAIRVDLKREKEAIVVLLKDPGIADWHAIDLKRLHGLLSGIGIDPAVIASTLSEYQQQARKIGKQIAELGNEVGNQLADLIGAHDPEAALVAARKLEEKSRGVAVMKEELMATTHRLLAANQILRQQLSLKPLLTIAKLVAGSKKDLFDSGVETLNVLLADPEGVDSDRTLVGMRQEPSRIEGRYQRLDVTKLPRLAEEILFHYIEEAVTTCREINTFMAAVSDRLARELAMVAAIENDLKALSGEPPAALVNGLLVQAGIMNNLVSALYHKRQIKDTLATVHEALTMLNIFHLLLKNKIIPGLQREVETAGAILNPSTIAGRMTRSFFTGAAGIIRSLKLMMTSLKGQPSINEIDLQLILENGIINCKTFYGGSREELKKMKLYIDTLVGQYPKPFPYSDLFKLAKTTLSAYGDEVEKFIHDHEIPKEMPTLTTLTGPAKVGKLIAAIGRQKVVFQKANAET